jgi:flagellar biosynthesis/type III secretory pathway protein FliH
MSRRFVPPAVAVFGSGADAELAQAVARAREEGFLEGRLHGLQEGTATGRQEGEAETREVMQQQLAELRAEYAKLDQQISVAAALDRVLAARSADLAALEHATRTAISAALQTLFPVLLARTAGQEIAALLHAALTERPTETLRLRAHPDTLDAIADDTNAMPDRARLAVAADSSLAPGTAELAWTGGGLTFDPDALLARVMAVLDATRPPDDAPPTSTPITEPAKEP